jgi:hypothetical protein
MHLDDSTLDPYLARSLDRTTLRELDAHVVTCPMCTLTAEGAALDPARWDRRGLLGRLVRLTPEAVAGGQLERAA